MATNTPQLFDAVAFFVVHHDTETSHMWCRICAPVHCRTADNALTAGDVSDADKCDNCGAALRK